jgi:hypothetical protein
MTQTLTTEQLQEIYEAAVHVEDTLNDPDAEFELYSKLDEIGGVESTIRKLIDMMRAANREAQPVQAPFMYAICNPDGSAWLDENCVAGTTEELKPVLSDLRRDNGDGFRIVPLFTAPPAPVVNPEFTGAPAVPDISALTDLIVDRLIDCSAADDDSIADAETFVYNACRAAMLDGSGILWSGFDPAKVSSDAIPDGWKLMPIEMTDEIGEAIAMEARCCGGIALCIYEAALAAAPEGGNGA